MNKMWSYGMLFLLCMSLATATLVIQEPSFNAEFAFDTSPNIQWSGCDENSFLLQLATDGLFDEMVFQQVVTDNNYELDFDLDVDTYFLRVQGIDDQGEFSCVSPTTEFKIKENAPLAFSFDTSSYDQDQLIIIEVKGPDDAQVSIDITSNKGFHLPIEFDDLSQPTFELVLNPATYTFEAESIYADGELFIQQSLVLEDVSSQTTTTTQHYDDSQVSLSVIVEEFEGDLITDTEITVIGNKTNQTISLNDSGEGMLRVDKGEYELFFEKEGFTPKDRKVDLQKDKLVRFVVLAIDDSDDDSSDVQEEVIKEDPVLLTLEKFDQSAYSTSYVPVVFLLSGSPNRCQILSKSVSDEGYTIAQTVLKPKEVNEVVLTKLLEGSHDIRVRCILSSDEAIISKTQSITTVNIDKDILALEEARKKSQKVIDKINSFPSSFKQVFINDIVSVESYLAKTSELIKEAKSSDDILQVRKNIQELAKESSQNILNEVKVDSSQSVILYGNIDEVNIVRTYLDLSKKAKNILEDQEKFAIKTNYNFVILTYSSGEVKKQTFISSQVLPVQGISDEVSWQEYVVMPSFLTSRLASSNDVLVKAYGDASLVRLLENASALIFDGWLDDTQLVKTIVIADSFAYSSTPTGLAINSLDMPEWKVPLIAFIIIILIAGLFFNPYYSVADIFEKNDVKKFTSKVNDCLDASLAKHHFTVIEMVPLVLDSYDKLSKEEKAQAQEIIGSVRELFYDASYNLALQKISSKPAVKWSYEELAIAIKDYYGSYGKLSPAKQKLYLTHFNQMLAFAQKLLAEVKK